MNRRLVVGVLASGSGSNFQALVDRFETRAAPAKVALLIASRPGIGALERAARAGIPSTILDPEADEEGFLLERLSAIGTDLVVLAGWLKLVPPAVVRAFWGRMINIHPALLPAFGGAGRYGMRVHRAVIEAGVRVTGVTVHYVDERYDRGPIIGQWPVPVREGDTPKELAARVLEVEHRVLPRVIEAIAHGLVALDEAGRCRWRGDWFASSRFVMRAEPGGIGIGPEAGNVSEGAPGKR